MSSNANTQSLTSKGAEENNAAFILSLIGGILITIGSLGGVSFAMMGRPFFWGMGGMMSGQYSNFMNGMMGEYYANSSYPSGFYSVMAGYELLGLISGVLVLAFALLMRSKPENTKTYGIVVLVFSIVSFVGTGGFFIGAILGIIGGILALTSK